MSTNEFPTSSGIYCFENNINGKKYIGKSINLRKRIRDHINQLVLGKDECSYLQNAWIKQGEDNFSIYILEECDFEILSDREIFYIEILKSKRPEGYNLTDGGDGSFGFKHSDETKEHLSKIRKGKYSGENSPLYGKHLSEDTKNKLSIIRTGSKHSEKTKSLLSFLNGEENHYLFGRKRNFSSVYLGVNSRNGKWISRIKVDGKSIYLGMFESETEAAIAYDRYILQNSLNNYLNFPDDIENILSYEFETKSSSSSEYTGVYYSSQRDKWVAQIVENNKTKYLGCFEEEVIAAKKYDKYVIENNLPHPLNFPEDYE